ncbi:leucine-rich_repeat domain-containing protein [Hexamita inflata]|uniref:Leucine-rich repeat domain-containing protein n=1 Tax=Hexamita inflata TaxID=28002 RepID=A0AA86UZN2_9EUKA|nr:leucine-rich repeat domain-containing protein [Hexamita inflata]
MKQFQNDQQNLKIDQQMIEKYTNKIENHALKIEEELNVFNLEFIQYLDINKLELKNCCNLQPKLINNHIKELIVNNCDDFNLEEFQLENLEVLKCKCQVQFANCSLEFKDAFVHSIVKFNKLKELSLNDYFGVDISPLSQMTQLMKLSLVQCGLGNVDSLKYLVNLVELNISQNQNVDITPLKNLPLTVLNLSSCDFLNVEILASFIHVQELNLFGNEDIDITPIQNLLQIVKLDLSKCKLGNVSSLKKLVNLKELNISLNKNIDISQLQYLPQLLWCPSQL